MHSDTRVSDVERGTSQPGAHPSAAVKAEALHQRWGPEAWRWCTGTQKAPPPSHLHNLHTSGAWLRVAGWQAGSLACWAFYTLAERVRWVVVGVWCRTVRRSIPPHPSPRYNPTPRCTLPTRPLPCPTVDPYAAGP